MSILSNNTATMEEILELIETLPEGGGATSFEYVNENTTEVPAYAFFDLPLITSAVFTKVTTIGERAFAGCRNMITADFPLATTAGLAAFTVCPALKYLNVPLLTSIPGMFLTGSEFYLGGVFPNVTSIGNQAFQLCKGIVKLDFPIVTSIGSNAFANCKSLTALILRSPTMCTAARNTILSGTPIRSGDGYIYVPAALVDTYKADSVWKGYYANKFRALEDYTVDGTTTGELDETKI